MKQTINLNNALYNYVLDVSLRETSVLSALREETATLEMGRMQISPDQGQFMAMLIKLIAARNVIEIGTFTGYSALCMAAALGENGKLLACDNSEEWTNIARRYWQLAGLDSKIDLRLGVALDTLDNLLSENMTGKFDFAFIDADKANQRNYYNRCLQLVRVGGIIAIDNVLWGGSVIDDSDQTEDTCAIRSFNQFLHADERVDISLIPIGDGLTLARKL